VFLVSADYVYTISGDGKGIESVAGKQNRISSGKLNGLFCPQGC